MSESTKNKIFWTVFVLSILVSVGLTYVRIFVKQDYVLVAEVTCDPETEKCFEYTPEELCEESEDLNCVENTESEFYKIIHKKAYNVPECTEADFDEEGNCPELVCEEGESDEECYYEVNE